MTDPTFDEVWGDYYERMEDAFGPYGVDDSYTGRPIDESSTRVGETHHAECPSIEPEDCTCKALYERDYNVRQEQEADTIHEEWWT